MCSGTFLFNLNTSSLSVVAEKVVDELLDKNEIQAGDREGLLRALLMRRRFIFFFRNNARGCVDKHPASISFVLPASPVESW